MNWNSSSRVLESSVRWTTLFLSKPAGGKPAVLASRLVLWTWKRTPLLDWKVTSESWPQNSPDVRVGLAESELSVPEPQPKDS